MANDGVAANAASTRGSAPLAVARQCVGDTFAYQNVFADAPPRPTSLRNTWDALVEECLWQTRTRGEVPYEVTPMCSMQFSMQ